MLAVNKLYDKYISHLFPFKTDKKSIEKVSELRHFLEQKHF